MIRICAVIGSMAGAASSTARYADMLVERIGDLAKLRGEEVSYKRLLASDLSVGFCKSCNACFFRDGGCPLDASDDMPVVKQSLLNADVILLGSPVYLGMMSGVTKAMLDRISYWSHRFELVGKVGYAFATTSRSHGDEVAQGLLLALQYFGCSCVGARFARSSTTTRRLLGEDELQVRLDEDARNILDAYDDPFAHVSRMQRVWYATLRQNAALAKKLEELTGIEPRHEVNVCVERGMLKCATLEEYASHVSASTVRPVGSECNK